MGVTIMTLASTRFAPSPNGPLHLGHAYAAIVAHDLARERGGQFLLRIEDIDGSRSRDAHIWELIADLKWLGLDWDEEPVFQTSRIASYARAGERLMDLGLLYPCTCSRSQIAAAARDHGPDGPIYPGTCRGKTAEPGADVAWRLDLERAVDLAGPLDWYDERAGRQRAWPEMFGDVILLRREAPASYHLAATLDDAADQVSLVTRGRDLFTASHIHRLLQALLDLPVPVWHHHLLICAADGAKLAKRKGSPALADLRRAGEDGRALAETLRQGRLPAGLSFGERVDNAP
jgi:glutamyl-Q tRNA(Asp) synthetase